MLSQPGKLSAGDMQSLQTDTRDFLAAEMVPALLRSLSVEKLSATEATAVDFLKSWDFRMETSSVAATIWWHYWGWYLTETFQPWWKSRAVNLDIAEVWDALTQDLETWTLSDPNNRTFSAPGVGPRSASDAQRKSFHKLISDMAKMYGPDPHTWTYSRAHQRVLENLADISGLNYGPRPERGDGNTRLRRAVTRPRTGQAGGWSSTGAARPSWAYTRAARAKIPLRPGTQTALTPGSPDSSTRC